MKRIVLPIVGMHCKSCEILIEEQLKKVSHVHHANVEYKRGCAEVFVEGHQNPVFSDLQQAVVDAGYNIGEKKKLPWISRNPQDYKYFFLAAALLWVLYGLGKWFGIFDWQINSNGVQGVWIGLLVGIVAGVSTCMALVGGLVLAFSARHAELHPEASGMEKFRPHLYFNAGRILGYGVFGGLVGLLGSALTPSARFLGLMTLGVGLVMILLGLKLVEIFPVLRETSITLPKFISRWLGLHREVREYSHKQTFMAGAFSFFLPCGFTQAMQLYALSTGSFTTGAQVMMLFALGTAPGLLSIGGLSSFLKGRAARVFFMSAGIAVILMGWVNVNNGRLLFAQGPAQASTKNFESDGAVQEVRMTQDGRGYSPSVLYIKKDIPVRWIINSANSFTCASSLVMPEYGISRSLQKGENIIVFTPAETGEITFSCSMGMYRGKFIVSEGKDTLQKSSSGNTFASDTVSGESCGSGGCGCGGGGTPFVPQNGTTESGVSSAQNERQDAQVLQTTYTLNTDIQPNVFDVTVGKPVRFEINVQESGYGCMSSILIPDLYDIPQRLVKGKTLVMEFVPKERGEYAITCSMGVPRGVIRVN